MKKLGTVFLTCVAGLWAIQAVPLSAQSTFVYTNDNIQGANTVSGLSAGSGGMLSLIPGSPFATGGIGNDPVYFATPRIVASPTGAFLYVANGGSNNVSVFSINAASGGLTLVPGAPFATASQGGGDLALAVSPDNKFLFSGDTNTGEVTTFSIGVDGTLSIAPGSPYLVPDLTGEAFIAGMKVSPDGSFLAITLPSTSSGDSEIAIYSIGPDGSLASVPGSPFRSGDRSAGVEFSCSASTLFTFDAFLSGIEAEVDSVAANGVLSPVSGSPVQFTKQGVNSNVGILSPNGATLYLSDQYSGQVTGLSIASNGDLKPITGSPFATALGSCPTDGNCPVGLAINRAGTLLFLASWSPEVAVLSVAADGTLTPVPGSPFTTGLSSSNATSLAAWPAPVCPPLVNLSQSTLAFGNQALGNTSGIQSATLANASPNSALTITSIVAHGDYALASTGTSCPYGGGSVSSRTICTIDVTFTPSLPGSDPNTVTITDNGWANPQTLVLTGTGTVPAVGLSPLTLTFGNQSIGTRSASQSVSLVNTGSAALAIASITTDANFVQTNTCGSTLATSGSCTIEVTFTPTTVGPIAGTLTITDNAAGSPQSVTLTGTGTAPAVSLFPASLIFSSLAVGSTSSAQTITLTNTGTAALTIASVALTGTNTGDFAQSNTCGSSVAASGTCTISVTFKPSAAGTRTASVSITDNATGSPQTVVLTGSATDATPVVSLAPASLTFASQTVGTTSSAQATTLTNTGAASLTFRDIAVSGPFTIAAPGTTCSASTPVAPSGVCTVAVTFSPTAGGAASGSLSFADNANSSPQTVGLRGTGQDFTLNLAVGTSSSASVFPGATASYVLAVGSRGGPEQSISFVCTGAPAHTSCQVSPTSVTLGDSGTNITVTVVTTARSVDVPRSRELPPVIPILPATVALATLAVSSMGAVLSVTRWRPLRACCQPAPLVLTALLMMAVSMMACGGGGAETAFRNPGTPAGTYTLTVTGSTGSPSSISHAVTLTLKVS